MTRSAVIDDADAILRLADPPDGFFDDPYPHYRALRVAAPIAVAGDGSLLLTRYADLATIYRDTATFSSDKKAEFAPRFGDGPLFEHHTTSLVFSDDPYHGRVRRRLVGALTPRAVAALGEGLEAYCDRLLDNFVRGHGGDAIADYAAAIPVRVIGDMLGVPEADRHPLRGWSLAILGALEPAPDTDRIARGNAAVAAFAAYLGDLIVERRRTPRDPESDLLTRLIASDADGTELSAGELIHNAIFLLNAGHETTSNLIGNALHLIATNEEARMHSEPDEARFVEEVLRFESPNQLGNRRATRDTRLGGVAIAEGTLLTLVIGAANRDPEIFAEPDRFDPRREPNRHLAFGAGSHQCAGLSLARLEARIALSAWRRRIAHFRLSGPAVRQRRVRFRGLETLPVAL
ncbi:MAG: cytochrome [Sphingomonas bacterium]|uniref:cytochrome P450 n=1 Tax=Sphingomonas bacterium TaxID=1895847 RepID=UPI0026079281|nr:cytochrome P450 [Sphingomonas bacterium]MDB5710412.1 cytochrome [Sphingomonas bacterium]